MLREESDNVQATCRDCSSQVLPPAFACWRKAQRASPGPPLCPLQVWPSHTTHYRFLGSDHPWTPCRNLAKESRDMSEYHPPPSVECRLTLDQLLLEALYSTP